MLNPAITDPRNGVAALLMMGLLRTLITESSREVFTRVDLLVVIDSIMCDPEFFTEETLEQFAVIDAEPVEV